VLATGADALSPQQLAGALLSAIEITDTATKEVWRKRGVAFFQSAPRIARCADKNKRSNISSESSAPPPSGEVRT